MKGLKKDEQRKILLNGGYFQPYGADSVGCRKHVLQRVYLQRVFGFGGADISHGVALFRRGDGNNAPCRGVCRQGGKAQNLHYLRLHIVGRIRNGFRAFTKGRYRKVRSRRARYGGRRRFSHHNGLRYDVFRFSRQRRVL